MNSDDKENDATILTHLAPFADVKSAMREFLELEVSE